MNGSDKVGLSTIAASASDDQMNEGASSSALTTSNGHKWVVCLGVMVLKVLGLTRLSGVGYNQSVGACLVAYISP